MTHDTWILVADAARARLFLQQHGAASWRLVQTFAHARSAAKGRDIMADRPGRVQQSVNDGTRSAMTRRTDPKTVEATHFAGELSTALDSFLHDQAGARLVLVAPPRFLGLLRQVLREPVRSHVVSELARDLTRVAEHDLPEQVAKAVA
jgi:protein required for attachment to host cells